jgi:hypothetical protein
MADIPLSLLSSWHGETRPGTPPAGGGFAANPTQQAAFKACGATGKQSNAG